MVDTDGAASGAITARAVADGDAAGRTEMDLDELKKAEALKAAADRMQAS